MNSFWADRDPAHAIKCELARETLETSGVLRICVNGWSMLPSIWPGDMLVIYALRDSEVSCGDIVLLERDNRLFVHRAVARSKDHDGQIYTRGDAMPQADPPVRSGDLLGKVQYIIRNRTIVAPNRKLRLHGQIVAGLARRSSVAARFIVGMKGLQQRLHASRSQTRAALARID